MIFGRALKHRLFLLPKVGLKVGKKAGSAHFCLTLPPEIVELKFVKMPIFARFYAILPAFKTKVGIDIWLNRAICEGFAHFAHFFLLLL